MTAQADAVTLPHLTIIPTTAMSPRSKVPHHLVVAHRWAGGTFDGVIAEFKNRKNEASSHGVYAGEVGHDKGKCAQMIPLSMKAWTCEDFNSSSDNWEFGDAMWLGHDPEGLKRAARIIAFNLQLRRYPPTWVHGQSLLHGAKGFCRHYDLGVHGGGHTDPTTDAHYWQHFVGMVQAEYHRGGFRPHWLEMWEV